VEQHAAAAVPLFYMGETTEGKRTNTALRTQKNATQIVALSLRLLNFGIS